MKVERQSRQRQQRQTPSHQPPPASVGLDQSDNLHNLTAMASLAPATLPTQPQPQFTLPSQPYTTSTMQAQQAHQPQQQTQQQVMMMQQQVTAGQKLVRRGHQLELLHQAKLLCDRQDYVDLTIYCEDGVVRAHQMLLAVASPFLKALFQTSPTNGTEDISIILPEIKVCLVQALVHFVYTGAVVTKEEHFYSLMKLVYALSINASIEAEGTNERPTTFSSPLAQPFERVRKFPAQSQAMSLGSLPIQLPTQPLSHLALAGSSNLGAPPNKIQRLMGPPANSVPVPPQNLANTIQSIGNSSLANAVALLPNQPVPPQNLQKNLTQVPVINGVATVKGEQTLTAHSTGGNSYIAIDPNTGMQYKVELPNGQLGDGLNDPLAAIMNETIFTETSGTMFTTENGQVIYTSQPTATVPTSLQPQMQQLQQPQQAGGGKKGKKRTHKENAILADSVDDLPCAPDDEDLNTPYQCDTCNKTIKGRVMLQAHQYQEHYENPNMGQIGEIGDKHACRVCLKLFTRNSDVKAHILRVHCGDRRYPCTMCGKRFKESTHLRKHLYTHTGERPHFCKLCGKGFQTSSDLKRHKRTRVHQEKVEQVAAAGGDIDDDEAIITGTGMVVSATSANTSEVLEGHEAPEFKVWSEGQDEESRNSAASNQQAHVENATDLLSNIQQQQPSTTIVQSVGYSSTIDMKDLGGTSAASSTATSWSAAAAGNSNPVNTTAPGTVASKSKSDPLSTAANSASLSGGGGTTVDMNLLKWQGNQNSSMPSVGGPSGALASAAQSRSQSMAPPPPSGRDSGGGKRSSSIDSPGQDEERLTVVEGEDSQDSSTANTVTSA